MGTFILHLACGHLLLTTFHFCPASSGNLPFTPIPSSPYPRTIGEAINEETRVPPRLVHSVERKNIDILFSYATLWICKTNVTSWKMRTQGLHTSDHCNVSFPVMFPSLLNLDSSWPFLSYQLQRSQLGKHATASKFLGIS